MGFGFSIMSRREMKVVRVFILVKVALPRFFGNTLLASEAAQQSLAADGAIVSFSSSLLSFSLNADRAAAAEGQRSASFLEFDKAFCDGFSSYNDRVKRTSMGGRFCRVAYSAFPFVFSDHVAAVPSPALLQA
jgi:hypothetical protein